MANIQMKDGSTDVYPIINLNYVDKINIQCSVSVQGGFATIGTVESLGVPNGATVVSFFIRGWAGSSGCPSLLMGSDGHTLYCMISNAPSSITINVRVFYTFL